MNRCPCFLLVTVIVIASVTLDGQGDVLVNARQAATTGHRGEALSMLESHLAQAPRDVDARLLYGLVLSWEGRYVEARTALQQVLAQAPGYTDARVALMNVEYWSGNSAEALQQARQILSGEPGNVTARSVRDRLDAAARRWWATTTYRLDAFNDEKTPWHEAVLYVTRRTPVGSIIVRGSYAARFDDDDQMVELEFYPRFRPGTYAWVNFGIAPEHDLYPAYRSAFDLYQSIGLGFEVSAGARYLDFGEITKIYVGTLTKYIGNWMLTGKVYHVPNEREEDSWSYYGGFRRYFGADGTSYVGVTGGHGLSREEVQSLGDLTTLNSNTVWAEFDWYIGRRFRLMGSGGAGVQEYANRPSVWQTTITSGFAVLF